jgi:hypothetical protein
MLRPPLGARAGQDTMTAFEYVLIVLLFAFTCSAVQELTGREFRGIGRSARPWTRLEARDSILMGAPLRCLHIPSMN